MYKEVMKGGTSGYTILRREEDAKKDASKKPTEPKPIKSKRDSAKLLPISEILNQYKREKEQHDNDQTRRHSVNIEIPGGPIARHDHKSMSRFTALENRNIQKSQLEAIASPNPGAKASVTLADNKVKDII
jgi:hypothetical protein